MVRILTRLALSVAFGLLAAAASAQTYPTKPIVFVVPFPPGASPDVTARLLAAEMAPGLGTIVVENKPGAAANIGAEFVRKAAPDGHTILVAPNIYAFTAALTPPPFDIVKDFTHIGVVTTAAFFLAVNAEALPADSLANLVARAKARPGAYAYATPGIGSPHHIGMELIKLQAGVDINHVPYKGMGQAVVDLLAGRVHMTITGLPPLAPHMAGGKIKLLAVAGTGRSALQPGVPTFAEAGIAGVLFEFWVGLFGPRGLPDAIAARLHAEAGKVLAKPDVRDRLAKAGLEPTPGTAAAMTRSLADDIVKYAAVVKSAGIKPE